MPVTVEEFRQRLIDSGLMSGVEIDDVLSTCASGEPFETADSLAKVLVNSESLTVWQAKQIYHGRMKRLVLGNYRLLDKLGQGGMGMVFKAEHQVMKRIVALKTLSAKITESADLLARFRREVQVAARLEHPNIVTAYDAACVDDVHFLVMQYVEGEDLSAYVQRQGTLSIDKALECVRQAALGLQYAHEQGVIHRDIKPSNMLIDKSGMVQVLDMGLARVEARSEVTSEITAAGAVMGTIDYMAPEQAEDTRQADARSDIYSLGCTLYYLLTGCPMFTGDTVVQRILAHREAPIPSLASAAPDVTPELDRLFRKMVAKQPAERYQTMEAVADKLRQLANPGEVSQLQPKISDDSQLDEFLRSIHSSSSGRQSRSNVSSAPTQVTNVADRRHDRADPDAEDFVLQAEFTQPGPPQQRSLELQPVKMSGSKKWLSMGMIAGVFILGVFFFLRGRNREPTENLIEQRNAEAVSASVTDDSVAEAEVERPIEPRNRMAVSAEVLHAGLMFDGIDDYAAIPQLSADDRSPVTLEAWLTCTEAYNIANPIMLMGQQWMTIYHNNQAWGVGKLNRRGPALWRSSASLLEGQRVHIAGIWDGEQSHLFVDGREVETVSLSYPLQPTPGGLYLGGAPADQMGVNEADRFFGGVIHQVRISTVVRYVHNFTPEPVLQADADTSCLYHLHLGTGPTVRDLSGNGHHGTVHGAIWSAARD